MGFTLLWIYMFWSQHIVTWYGDLPNFTGPVFKREVAGNFTFIYVVMMFALFLIPFFALAQRKVKMNAKGLAIVAFIICFGMWLNRYLMVMPEFTDGKHFVVISITGLSIILAGLSSVILSLIYFIKMYPEVTLARDFK